MLTDRQIQEMIARCVSIMVFHHKSSHKTPKVQAILRDGIQEVAIWALGTDMNDTEIQGGLFEPVKTELVERYGSTVGRRLSAIFQETFTAARESPAVAPQPKA